MFPQSDSHFPLHCTFGMVVDSAMCSDRLMVRKTANIDCLQLSNRIKTVLRAWYTIHSWSFTIVRGEEGKGIWKNPHKISAVLNMRPLPQTFP